MIISKSAKEQQRQAWDNLQAVEDEKHKRNDRSIDELIKKYEQVDAWRAENGFPALAPEKGHILYIIEGSDNTWGKVTVTRAPSSSTSAHCFAQREGHTNAFLFPMHNLYTEDEMKRKVKQARNTRRNT